MLLVALLIVSAEPRIAPGVAVGPLGPKTTEADLKPHHAVAREVYTGEGQCSEGAVLYPDDPARKLELVWTTKAHDAIAFVFVFGTAYRTRSGVHVGSTLEEIERLNGKPIVLNSFHMDYSGALTDYQGGKLAGELKGALVFTSPSGGKDGPDAPDLKSDDAAVRAAKPVVDAIRVDLGAASFESHACVAKP